MECLLKSCFTMLAVCFMMFHSYSTAVTGTDCNPVSGGKATCEAADPNAECPSGKDKCACKAGYKEGSQDDNTCVLKSVSEFACDPKNNDASTDDSAVCKAIDTNAECPTGTTKCACKSGYKEGPSESHTCVQKSVSEFACDPKNNDASTGESAVCTTIDTNAECPTGTTKCACKSGYKEGSPESQTCVQKSAVSETDCVPTNKDATTGGAAVCKAVDTNAECLTGTKKCACKTGYKEGSPERYTCVQKAVSEYACDPDDNDATSGESDVCKAVDTNAECPTDTTKCACKSGYKQDATYVNTCVKNAQSAVTMTSASMVLTLTLLYLLRFVF